MVDIIVGPSKTLYRVHKDRLCAVSFPEKHPDSFNVFLTWVYEDTLSVLKVHKHSNPTKTPKNQSWNWDPFDNYLLAQTLGLLVLQDRIMDALRSGQARTKNIHSLATTKDFPAAE
jgi:hypothetical protein